MAIPASVPSSNVTFAVPLSPIIGRAESIQGDSTSAGNTGISLMPGAAPIAQPAGQPAGLSPAPFADLLTEAVGQVDSLEGQARSAVEGLISGKGVDVHEAMIATENAEMGFELMLSVRNKALSAYQQILGMQF